MLDFEIAKYRRLGRADIVHWYETTPPTPLRDLEARFDSAARLLDAAGPW
jgi:hypothetical protein